MGWYYGYAPYVSVKQRQAQAAREVERRAKSGQSSSPVRIEGRKITTTFWGNAWCDNLELYSDFANRLPRGRTYVRNGSVVDLQISKGKITALVSGSSLYDITIKIDTLANARWADLKERCAGQIGSLVELLQGKLSKGVMELVTDREQGLFPKPKEIHMSCSCPDGAYMCKHLAAVMYGIGNRFDSSPELLFSLRAVDHGELIEQAIPAMPVGKGGDAPTIAMNELGAMFDIEIDAESQTESVTPKHLATTKASKSPKAKTAAARVKAKVAIAKTTAAPAKKKSVASKRKSSLAKKSQVPARVPTSLGTTTIVSPVKNPSKHESAARLKRTSAVAGPKAKAKRPRTATKARAVAKSTRPKRNATSN